MPGWLTRSTLLGMLALGSCSDPIVHDLDEAEANLIVGVLQQRGIPAEKLRSTEGNRPSYTVRVSRAQTASAWEVLRQENLPRSKPPGVSELFGKPGLVPTATQERTLMHHALAGELSRTLQALPAVLEARVHLVLPARDPLAPPDAAASSPRASVLLRLSPAADAVDRQEVQRLVAGSVDGLRPEAVSVVVTRAVAAPAAVPAGLTRLGPFWVGSSSHAALRGVLAVVVFASGLLLLVK